MGMRTESQVAYLLPTLSRVIFLWSHNVERKTYALFPLLFAMWCDVNTSEQIVMVCRLIFKQYSSMLARVVCSEEFSLLSFTRVCTAEYDLA